MEHRGGEAHVLPVRVLGLDQERASERSVSNGAEAPCPRGADVALARISPISASTALPWTIHRSIDASRQGLSRRANAACRSEVLRERGRSAQNWASGDPIRKLGLRRPNFKVTDSLKVASW